MKTRKHDTWHTPFTPFARALMEDYNNITVLDNSAVDMAYFVDFAMRYNKQKPKTKKNDGRCKKD